MISVIDMTQYPFLIIDLKILLAGYRFRTSTIKRHCSSWSPTQEDRPYSLVSLSPMMQLIELYLISERIGHGGCMLQL
jgi:hypothetical protein